MFLCRKSGCNFLNIPLLYFDFIYFFFIILFLPTERVAPVSTESKGMGVGVTIVVIVGIVVIGFFIRIYWARRAPSVRSTKDSTAVGTCSDDDNPDVVPSLG